MCDFSENEYFIPSSQIPQRIKMVRHVYLLFAARGNRVHGLFLTVEISKKVAENLISQAPDVFMGSLRKMELSTERALYIEEVA
jgi:hypothetical protein